MGLAEAKVCAEVLSLGLANIAAATILRRNGLFCIQQTQYQFYNQAVNTALQFIGLSNSYLSTQSNP
jgi:hypothetical protein